MSRKIKNETKWIDLEGDLFQIFLGVFYVHMFAQFVFE